MAPSLVSIAGFHLAFTMYRETVNRRSVTSDLRIGRDSSRNRAYFPRMSGFCAPNAVAELGDLK
jgi:hypothetical protein